MELPELYIVLSRMLDTNPQWRPFVCKGDPTKTVCWIVGYNPASEVRGRKSSECTSCHELVSQKDYMNYFCLSCGFDKARWVADYEATRRNMGRRTRRSVARGRIETILGELNGINQGDPEYPCLETNLYSTPTPTADQLTDFDTSMVEVLFRTLNPRAVLIHGKETAAAIAQQFGLDALPIDKFAIIKVSQRPVWVKAVPHLSARGVWNRDRVISLGREFRDAVAGKFRY